MKLVAKVKFIHEENAKYMIRAFFSEFDPRSSILIKGEEAKLEIFFKESPKEIIDSITHCGIVEFECGPYLCENEEEQVGKEKGEEHFQEEQTTGKELLSNPSQNFDSTENSQSKQENAAETEEVLDTDSESVETEENVTVISEETNQQELNLAVSNEVATTATDSEGVEEHAQEIPESKKQEEKNNKNIKKGKKQKCEIPELVQFAKKSESYEAFVKNVATWLNLGKNYDFFVGLAEEVILPTNGELSWMQCRATLGERYSNSRQNSCTVKIAEKFKGTEYNVTILKLLEAIIEYRTFNFTNVAPLDENPESAKVAQAEATKHVENVQKEEVSPAEEAQTEEENVKTSFSENQPADDESIPNNPLDETSMMSDILCFKKAVESVDKTQPIEARVKHVLNAMSVGKLTEKEQEAILEIANIAVQTNNMELDDILSKTNIPQEEALSARMTFATLINDVVKAYETNKQIKLIDFLKELQKGIMLEEEIE